MPLETARLADKGVNYWKKTPLYKLVNFYFFKLRKILSKKEFTKSFLVRTVEY